MAGRHPTLNILFLPHRSVPRSALCDRPADGSSSSKGVPEKQYAFDLQLYDEIIPEVCSDEKGNVARLTEL
jgi:hypothetical protein